MRVRYRCHRRRMSGYDGLSCHRLHHPEQLALERRWDMKLWLLNNHHETFATRHTHMPKTHQENERLHRDKTASVTTRRQRNGLLFGEVRDDSFENSVAVG